MASGNNSIEASDMESTTRRYKYEWSDSYSSNSSSQSTTARRASTLETVDFCGGNEDKIVSNENPSRADPGKKPPLKFSFHPNEKGTKKQKRSDYDSDERSYDGLGVEYKRRNLHDLPRRDALLPEKIKMVNFDHQGTKKWGDRLIFETLEDTEIDTLIALATFYDPNSDEEKMFVKESKLADVAASHDPQRRNPLLSATYDSPLPPSHIDYMKSRAFNRNSQSVGGNEDRCKRDPKSLELNSMALNFKDDLAVAMSMYLEESLTASLLPLAGLHVLRCRALETMASGEIDFGGSSETHFVGAKGSVKKRSQGTKICNDRYSANGLQQSLIHPITGEKVKLDTSRQIRWKDEDVFHEWTLPPEEAIFKLKEQGFLAKDFPYHFIPDASRSWSPEHLKKEASSNCRGNSDLSSSVFAEDDAQNCIGEWVKNSSTTRNIFSANREIFDIFLPQKDRTDDERDR